MNRKLRRAAIGLPLAGLVGVALNCSSTGGGTYVPAGGGGGTSSSSSATGSGTSTGGGGTTGGSSSSAASTTSSSSSASTGASSSASSSGGTSGSSSGDTSGSSASSSSASSSGGSGSNNSSDAGSSAASSSGSSSSSSSSGTGGAVTIDSLLGIKNSFGESFENSFILIGCYSQEAQDCIDIPPGTNCPNQNTALPFEPQGLTTHEYFQVGGTPGAMYAVTLQVDGISEAKYYENGTRAAGNGDPANAQGTNGSDTFYTGGDAVNVENYNIYKITVLYPPDGGANPPDGGVNVGAELQHYYLNSFPQTNTPYEDHQTFPISYTHTIPVVGGGTIEYSTADRNCHAVDNCGPGVGNAPCAIAAGRNVPNEPNLVIPTMYMGQPVSGLNTRNGSAQPFHAQIIHVTVTAVAPM